MAIIDIKIIENGKHWSKSIRVFGIPIYYRYDYTKEINKPQSVGFFSVASEELTDTYYDDNEE